MILPPKVNPGFVYVMQGWHFNPSIGPNGPSFPVVKVGHTNIAWQRLRTYRQAGIQYGFNKIWRGEAADCAALERMVLHRFKPDLLQNQVPALGCKEVVVKDIHSVISYIDEVAEMFFPSVDFTYEDYQAARLLTCPLRLPAVLPKKPTIHGIQLVDCFDDLFAV